MPETVLAWQLGQRRPRRSRTRAEPRRAARDGGRGLARGSSDDATLKLFLMGNKAGAGHTHEDKGSFVRRVRRRDVRHRPGHLRLLQPPRGDPEALPAALDARRRSVHPGVRIPRARCPRTSSPSVRATSAASTPGSSPRPGWEGTYRRWVRTWDSPGARHAHRPRRLRAGARRRHGRRMVLADPDVRRGPRPGGDHPRGSGRRPCWRYPSDARSASTSCPCTAVGPSAGSPSVDRDRRAASRCGCD